MMQAVSIAQAGGPQQIDVIQTPVPEPGPGELRVRLEASALNRRDVWIALGRYANMRLPCILGSDGAGVVDAVGPGVDPAITGREVVVYPARAWGDDPRHFGPDFRVLGMPDPGTFAEYICVPADDVQTRPAHLSWEEAAALPLAGLTAWRAVVTQAEVRAGQTVLVTGAGSGVSTFAVMWAHALGADVYVTSGRADKIGAAEQLGARGGVLYSREDWAAELRRKTDGFDAIIDSAGGDNFNACTELLKPAGRLVFFGATLGNPAQGPDLRRLFWRQIRVQGTTMGTPREFAAMVNFVAQRRLRPQVDSVRPLGQARDAFQRVLDFQQTGKVVLRNAG